MVGEAAACGVNPGERAAHAAVGVAGALAHGIGVGQQVAFAVPGVEVGGLCGLMALS